MCADFMPQMPDSKVDATDEPSDDRPADLAGPAEAVRSTTFDRVRMRLN